MTVPAEADVFVSLDCEKSKGIHMSRLFLALQERLSTAELTPAAIEWLLRDFIRSHESISCPSHLRIRCQFLLERDSLESGHRGWKSYPLEIAGSLEDGELRLELGLEVIYSSTCPCSAALSREIIARDFEHVFCGESAAPEEVAAWLRSEESLHPHDAVAVITKGVPGGFTA